jgi:predicted SAM-dependent methyltransferase
VFGFKKPNQRDTENESPKEPLFFSKGPYKVNLGCGASYHPEWINLDFVPHSNEVVQCDLRKNLPFADGVCSAVYHSHVLEHFRRNQGELFIRECFRVLSPGGVIRVVVPDLETIARLYLENLDSNGHAEASARHQWMTIELVDQLAREEPGGEMLKYWKQNPMPAEEFVISRMGREVLRFLEYFRSLPSNPHIQPEPDQPEDPLSIGKFRLSGEVHKWMYDRISLGRLLKAAGFKNVEVKASGESDIPDFNRYLLDLSLDGATRKPDSLFMEAAK